jgi:hypothetical protein
MRLLCFLYVLLLLSCNFRGGFYESYADGDLWRLPLVEPYELINLINADTNKQTTIYDWGLRLKYTKRKSGRLAHLNVNRINVKGNFIYGYGNAAPNNPFVIDTKNQKEFVFENKKDWESFLKERSIDTSTLRNVWTVFYSFKDEGILPWGSEFR